MSGRCPAACLLLLGLLLASACGGSDEGDGDPAVTTVEVSMRTVEAPAGEYFDAAWLAGDRIVVGVDLEERVSRLEPLRAMRGDGSGLEPLERARPDGECFRVVEQRPARLPDGRLGFMETCEREDITAPSRQRLLAWDLETEPETLLEAPAGISSYTWRPDLAEGLWSRDSGICAGIGTMARGDGLSGLSVTLPGADWPLDASLETADGDCTQEGRAAAPAWSPGGRTIAFVASPQSAGVEGQARLEQPWNLTSWTPTAGSRVPCCGTSRGSAGRRGRPMRAGWRSAPARSATPGPASTSIASPTGARSRCWAAAAAWRTGRPTAPSSSSSAASATSLTPRAGPSWSGSTSPRWSGADYAAAESGAREAGGGAGSAADGGAMSR